MSGLHARRATGGAANQSNHARHYYTGEQDAVCDMLSHVATAADRRDASMNAVEAIGSRVPRDHGVRAR